MRAVRFDRYGDVGELYVADVPEPVPGPDEVLVEVVSAGINPGEIAIREGRMHELWPATFPSGQGSDFAGRIAAVGDQVPGWSVGAEVIGFTDQRASHAELVAAPAANITARPAGVDWDQAGALKVAGTTAWASVRAVEPSAGDTVVVSGAAGGVGVITCQLLVGAGVRVVGIAGPDNHDWLRAAGVVPVAYGDGVEDRLRAAAPDGIAAFVDTFGGGYVALAVALGVAPSRINTIIDFAGAQEHGAQAVGGAETSTAAVLAGLAELIAAGDLVVPIAASYPVDQVTDAYERLARRHLLGKIVLHLR